MLANGSRNDWKAQAAFAESLTIKHRQALVWRFLATGELSEESEDQPPETNGEDQQKNRRPSWDMRSITRSLGGDVAEVLLAAFKSRDDAVRRRACAMAGDVGFDQQWPTRLNPKFIPLFDALVKAACSKDTEEKRLEVLKTLSQCHDHPAPWAHKLAVLLDDKSLKIRQQAASVISNCGPIAAVYFDRILAQFDIANKKEDAYTMAWNAEDIGWAPPKAVVPILAHIKTGVDPSPLHYVLRYAIASPEIADALLKVPIDHLGSCEWLGWLAKHASGDRRFIGPLLEALKNDWKSDSCSHTPYLAKALVAVGRNDRNLQMKLTELLDARIPPDARLFLASALSKLSGDPHHLADALVDVLGKYKKNPATYTDGRILDLLMEVGPAFAEPLEPYHGLLADMVRQSKQSSTSGYFILTGDIDPVLEWSRKDLDNALTGICSSFCGYNGVAYDLGPAAEPLTEQLFSMIWEGSDWNKRDACEAMSAIGPTGRTKDMNRIFAGLAKKFKPSASTTPALAIWCCTRNTKLALSILTPLLEDMGWGTTAAAVTLGKMGRDAKEALPRLRKLTDGPNPAYARWARDAVELIEKELSRKVEPAEMYEELASDDYIVSIRALWRLVELGKPAAKIVRDCMKNDKTAKLPGRAARRQARAQQVLELLESPANK
ncbi:MAG: hypothetical protein HZA50_14990 [Planctomycetes bacterium]|nr:hypothetical protein [Planctomycetota bacterium]